MTRFIAIDWSGAKSGEHAKIWYAEVQDGRLTRPDLLATDEISEGVRGYDRPLAKNTDAAIREFVLPHVEEHLPQLAPLLAAWLAH